MPDAIGWPAASSLGEDNTRSNEGFQRLSWGYVMRFASLVLLAAGVSATFVQAQKPPAKNSPTASERRSQVLAAKEISNGQIKLEVTVKKSDTFAPGALNLIPEGRGTPIQLSWRVKEDSTKNTEDAKMLSILKNVLSKSTDKNDMETLDALEARALPNAKFSLQDAHGNRISAPSVVKYNHVNFLVPTEYVGVDLQIQISGVEPAFPPVVFRISGVSVTK